MHWLESKMINLEMSNLCLVSFQSSRLFVSVLCSLQAYLDISCSYEGRQAVHSKSYYIQAWIWKVSFAFEFKHRDALKLPGLHTSLKILDAGLSSTVMLEWFYPFVWWEVLPTSFFKAIVSLHLAIFSKTDL